MLEQNSTTLTRELNASLVKEQVTDLILLAVLSMQKARAGEEQSSAVLHCLTEWSAVSRAYLKASGYAAADRSVGRVAVVAFLEQEGQREEERPPTYSDNLFSFGVALARQQGVNYNFKAAALAHLGHCLFCGSPIALPADLPYCSPECSESARRS